MGRAKGKKLASFELDEIVWEAFKTKCTDQGSTASAVLIDFVKSYLHQGANSSEDSSEDSSEELNKKISKFLDDRLNTELDSALNRYLDSRFVNGELDSLILKAVNTYLAIALEKEREKTREFVKKTVDSLEDSFIEDFKPLLELTEKILEEQGNSSEEVSEETSEEQANSSEEVSEETSEEQANSSEEVSEETSEEQANSSEEVSEETSEEQANSSEEVSEETSEEQVNSSEKWQKVNSSEKWQKGDVGYLIEDGKRVEILTLWTKTAKVQEFYRRGQPFKIQIDQLSRQKVNEQQKLSLFTFEDTLDTLREWEATKKNSPYRRDPFFYRKNILARLHPYPTPNGEPWSIEILKTVLKDNHIKL